MTAFAVEPLAPEEFSLCAALWDMERHSDLVRQFSVELADHNRTTFLCRAGENVIGEISLVRRTEDPDYTIPGLRAYVSHLLVKKEFRRQGAGTALAEHLFRYAAEQGFSQLSLGVDLDNFSALKFYFGLGFDRILAVEEDPQGRFVKLLKTL